MTKPAKKLAAIVFTDIAGYTAISAENKSSLVQLNADKACANLEEAVRENPNSDCRTI